MLWESDHPSLASGNLPMRSDQPPRGGDHIEGGVTKTPTNANLGSYLRWWHRITVAPHRHQPVRRHFSDQGSLRWIWRCGVDASVPLRDKTLRRMLYETSAQASASPSLRRRRRQSDPARDQICSKGNSTDMIV